MAYDQIYVKGATSQLIEVMLRDSTTGQGKTGLAAASVTAYYIREGANANVSMTLDGTMTLGTWKTLGWVEVDSTHQKGLYQLGIPNAAIVTGANAVTLILTATGVIDKSLRLLLVDADLRNATTLGLSALPNAAAGASGGLPLSVDTSGRVDVLKINGTSQTARDIGASVLLSAGTGTGQLDFTSGVVKANAVQLLGTAWLTPGVAGTPDVNAKQVGGTAQTGRDLGASVLLSSGTGTGQLDFTSGVVKANAVQLLGTAWLTPGVAGTPDVNAKLLGGTSQTGRDVGASVLLSAGTGAGQLDFTSGVVKANLVQILATALTETAGQIAGAFKNFFNVAAPTLTCLDINQTGDSYARIGAAGVGLTNLGDTRIAHLDADISSRTKPADTQAAVTTVTNLTNAPTAGDFTATMKTSLNAATPALSSAGNTAVAAAVGARVPAESYAANGANPTYDQFLNMLWAALAQYGVTGTTISVKGLGGSEVMTFTTDSSTAPTIRTRTT